MPQKDVTMFEICPKLSVESMIRNEMFLFEFKLMYQSTVDEEHLPTSRGWVRNSPTKKAEN